MKVSLVFQLGSLQGLIHPRKTDVMTPGSLPAVPRVSLPPRTNWPLREGKAQNKHTEIQ